YFNYFEDARVKYLQDLKIKYNLQEVMEDNSFFIMRRNEIEYIEPAQFDDKLIVFTKIDWIKNTSFGFSHVIINELTKRLIAIGTGILVYIKLSTKEKQQLPAEFYEAVNEFEIDVLMKKD
ncbi:MAG: thioesterase family protein, partial [Melioribacteraceae bacterium]|nr:thioesterase family protein [Melioribacteraceae bacterium]